MNDFVCQKLWHAFVTSCCTRASCIDKRWRWIIKKFCFSTIYSKKKIIIKGLINRRKNGVIALIVLFSAHPCWGDDTIAVFFCFLIVIVVDTVNWNWQWCSQQNHINLEASRCDWRKENSALHEPQRNTRCFLYINCVGHIHTMRDGGRETSRHKQSAPYTRRPSIKVERFLVYTIRMKLLCTEWLMRDRSCEMHARCTASPSFVVDCIWTNRFENAKLLTTQSSSQPASQFHLVGWLADWRNTHSEQWTEI